MERAANKNEIATYQKVWDENELSIELPSGKIVERPRGWVYEVRIDGEYVADFETLRAVKRAYPNAKRRAQENVAPPAQQAAAAGKTFEVFHDAFRGRYYVIDSQQDANGKRIFEHDSQACEKAIELNLSTISELLALNVKLQARLVHATAQETARICSGNAR
jgi:hypothetical protein